VTARKSSASAAAPERLRPALAPSATACFATRAHAAGEGRRRVKDCRRSGSRHRTSRSRRRSTGPCIRWPSSRSCSRFRGHTSERSPPWSRRRTTTRTSCCRRRRIAQRSSCTPAAHECRGQTVAEALGTARQPGSDRQQATPKSRPANTWRKSFTSPSIK
jgi:hypothetical protein